MTPEQIRDKYLTIELDEHMAELWWALLEALDQRDAYTVENHTLRSQVDFERMKANVARDVVESLRTYRKVFGEIPMSIRYSESEKVRNGLQDALNYYENFEASNCEDEDGT